MDRRPIGLIFVPALAMFASAGCNGADPAANTNERNRSTAAPAAPGAAVGSGTPFHAQAEFVNVRGTMSGVHLITVFYALPDGSLRVCRWQGPERGQETIPLGCTVHSQQQ